MQIKELEFYDNEYKWRLEKVDFFPNLNLLVGVSGAGKTRILRAIRSLKLIANGKSLNGVKWSVCFVADDGLRYTWSGEFETKEEVLIGENSEGGERAKVLNEKLVCKDDEVVLIDRKDSVIIFDGVATPKLSPFESVIELLKQEDRISPVKEALDKIILTYPEYTNEVWRLSASMLKKFEGCSLASLQKSNLPLPVKLSILYRVLPDDFARIKEIFMSIFPNVSDVKIDSVKNDDMPIALSKLLQGATKISIKEKGLEGWIENISSGMLKTLMYVSEMYLTSEGCVILIDEFENSFGVNCLDSVTELVLNNESKQFIITSHHPYIINNFSPGYWKIVTRKAGLVTVKNSEDFHIPRSRQKAFIDLINILESDEESEE